MNKEFIPCEQAIEINKLGFNQPCIAYYNIAPFLKKPALNIVKPFEHEWCVPAMLYQQAFRFFREKYGLVYNIELDLKDDEDWWYEWSIILPCGHYHDCVATYEEAELACLKKLIEISKKNNL